jgi:hypothetical protein
MTDDPKSIVATGYDLIAEGYLERGGPLTGSRAMAWKIDHPASDEIACTRSWLWLGCPVARELARRRHDVVAIDGYRCRSIAPPRDRAVTTSLTADTAGQPTDGEGGDLQPQRLLAAPAAENREIKATSLPARWIGRDLPHGSRAAWRPSHLGLASFRTLFATPESPNDLGVTDGIVQLGTSGITVSTGCARAASRQSNTAIVPGGKMQVSKIPTGGSAVARFVLPRDESPQTVAACNPAPSTRPAAGAFLATRGSAWGVPSLTVRAWSDRFCDLRRWRGARASPILYRRAAAIPRRPIAEETHWPRRRPT